MSDQSVAEKMDAAADEIGDAIGRDLAAAGYGVPPSTPMLKPVERREPTLVEQVAKMEQIGSTLRSRIRREQLQMQHEFEHRAVEVRNSYERKIHDAITKLEKEREAELLALTEDYNSRTREHELLTKRMGS